MKKLINIAIRFVRFIMMLPIIVLAFLWLLASWLIMHMATGVGVALIALGTGGMITYNRLVNWLLDREEIYEMRRWVMIPVSGIALAGVIVTQWVVNGVSMARGVA